MMRPLRSLASLVVSLLACQVAAFAAPPIPVPEWPEFRGPGGQGQATATGLPKTWSETENVAWKAAIPGLGWSSPVIGGGKIWLTTATEEGRSLRVVAVDQTTGKIVQDVEVFPKNTPGRLHSTNSHASPTPILDGDRLYVHYGSYGTACLSTDGKIIWTTALVYTGLYGPGSTPVLYKDLLIITCQGTDTCFTVALDATTGKERWKAPHKGRNSDATPLLIKTAGGDQLVCNVAEKVVAYDPKSGKELWTVSQGNNYAQVPRPVSGHGLVFVCGGYFDPIVQAIKPDGSGDVTKTHVVWSFKKGVPQNPSPLLVGEELYLVNDAGIASCLDAKSGKLHWQERIGGTYYASPTFADGRIYFVNTEGMTTVIAAGVKFETVAKNKLTGRVMASPAAVGHALYLRTDKHLYRIESKDPPKP